MLAEDKLFATLDPTTRRLRFPREREIIIADTVGFIRDLPRDLAQAFRATLEELDEADLLLHVVDAADPDNEQQIAAVERILTDLGLAETPRLLVMNKVDLLTGRGGSRSRGRPPWEGRGRGLKGKRPAGGYPAAPFRRLSPGASGTFPLGAFEEGLRRKGAP